jgi:hypothetical protein
MIKNNNIMHARKIKTGRLVKWATVFAAVVISLFIILTEDNLSEMDMAKSAFLTFAVFIAVCACIYYGVLAFFSLISGWLVLSRRSPAQETDQPGSVLFSSQSVEMGYMYYARSVNIRFTETGLVFSQSRLFSFMHRPFIIPYEKTGNSPGKEPSASEIEFTAEKVRIRMSGESAEALKKKILDPSIPVVTLRPAREDTEESMKRGERRLITRKCRFEELQPVFVSDVRAFINSKNPGKHKSSILHCYETTYMEKGFFGIVYHQYTDLAITPEWFFWGIIDGDSSSQGCAGIKDIAKIPDIERVLTSDPIEISGINITNFHNDESHLDSWRLNVANDKDGESFRKELLQAVRKQKS